jgi:pimeloyl-ACP methyl ester carboxylesterase
MDGTGDLFSPLRGVMPAGLPTRVVAYPVDEALSYDELLARLTQQLAGAREVVLIAESFSGPLALRYAADFDELSRVSEPGRVRAVVVCASFVRPPAPRWLRHLAWPLLLWAPPPDWAVRRLMVGTDAPDELVRMVKSAVRKVRPAVLARRVREVLSVDCADALRRCEMPVLWLAPTADALLRSTDVEAVRALNPRVTVATLDGPHLLLQARPAEAWNAVAEFLARHGIAAGP